MKKILNIFVLVFMIAGIASAEINTNEQEVEFESLFIDDFGDSWALTFVANLDLWPDNMTPDGFSKTVKDLEGEDVYIVINVSGGFASIYFNATKVFKKEVSDKNEFLDSIFSGMTGMIDNIVLYSSPISYGNIRFTMRTNCSTCEVLQPDYINYSLEESRKRYEESRRRYRYNDYTSEYSTIEETEEESEEEFEEESNDSSKSNGCFISTIN